MAQAKRKAGGAKKAGKGTKAPKKERKIKAAANGHTEPRGEKTKEISRLLQRKTGCTAADVKAMSGWKAVSMPQMAKNCGLKLRKEKIDGKEGGPRAHTRYYGTPLAG